jgi:L-aspartate oxidase
VHGANRLASNSLLEAAVFGRRAGEAARDGATASAPLVRCPVAPELPASALQSLRQAMSRDAGVVRDAASLGRLLSRIDALQAEHGRALPLVAARLVTEAALARRESRGGHFRADHPEARAPERTFVTLAEPACQAA